MTVDYNIKVAGAAGQGIQTIGNVLARTFLRGGHYVFGIQHYYSRIRGGHNFFQLRVSDKPIDAMREKVNILIALDEESISEHLNELENGLIVIDRDSAKTDEDVKEIFHVPLQALAKENGGSTLYSNTVAVGAVLGLLCHDFKPLGEVLIQIFKKKSAEIIQNNLKSAKAGYSYAQSKYPGMCHLELKSSSNKNTKMLLSGNEAVGLGALNAGLKFLSAYPMTPSTGVFNYIASKADKLSVIVEQAEDEISAINMALGASFAGARSMTTTSGGGFSLMVEGLGLSGMTETPIVIFLCQRPGPATGLPTMTEQGDLEFALHAAQGEFPRCILAPKTAEDAFYLSMSAFNIADKYQIPVFLLSDQYLADSLFTCDRFDPRKVKIKRHIISDSELKRREYKRYRFTDDGISPRALPGQAGVLVVADSDEHNEEGHIDESLENRISMNNKRLKKLISLKDEIMLPEVVGPDKADISLIGWGSSFGPLKEVVELLNKSGKSINLIHFTYLFPLPEGIKDFLEECERIISVENNAMGQFARVLKAELSVSVDDLILKYDGRPFTPDYILEVLNDIMGE